MDRNFYIAPAAAPTSTNPAPGGGLFGLPPKPAESTSPAASGSTTQPVAGASATSTSTAPGGSLFSGGGLFGKSPTAPGASAASAVGSATGPSATSATGLFGAKTDEKKDGAAAPANSKIHFHLHNDVK